MRLFISYARVDRLYCQQIVDVLDVHEVWYDHRLHAGQKWWEEILRRLAWCDGFIYLLSRESVASEYCQKEFAIATQLGKSIFPVLIHQTAPIPEALRDIQYADLSGGLDAKTVKQLLSAIYIAERENGEPFKVAMPQIQAACPEQPPGDPALVIDKAATALDTGDFDKAVYLLKRAREIGYASRFIDIEAVLQEAERALERQTYLREAEREYRSIQALIKHQRTFRLGCEAFHSFRKHYPDFDPDNLASICVSSELPIIEWCEIPAGEAVILRDKKSVIYHVDSFKIGKYPITNAQFQAFIEAKDGYCDDRWWKTTPASAAWHETHRTPLEARFEGANYPRVNVCWYEAVAFCQWYSARSGLKIGLPSTQQWQRAARGDQHYRYPWGERFQKDCCNTKETGLRMTTPVNCYPSGASPFGVYDMAGNVWEWTSTSRSPQKDGGNGDKLTYLVHGGSFLGGAERAQNGFYFQLDAVYRYFTIGFRVVLLD